MKSDFDASLPPTPTISQFYPDNTQQSEFPIDTAGSQQVIDSSQKSKGTRTKERRICDVIEAVTEWRRLYNGNTDKDGNLLRYSLDDAANAIGISKKSLDDYLLQLRFGRKYGFDFNNNQFEKVGVLRLFVKQAKLKEKQLKEKQQKETESS